MLGNALLGLLLQVPLSASAPADSLPAALAGLGDSDLRQVRQLEARIEAAGGWWLELESQLLIAAPPAALPALVAGLKIQQQLAPLTPQDLALQARGCADPSEAGLPALALAGRFALVRAPRAGRAVARWAAP